MAQSSTAPGSSAGLSSKSGAALSASSPSFTAALLGALIGLGLLVFSTHLFLNAHTSYPLNLAIAALGLGELACSYFVVRAVRVAWAFALSINGTAAVVLLFSAPRIRDAAEVSIALALLPSLLAFVIVILHSLKPEEF